VLAEILQAVTDTLNDHVFSVAFTATRSYLPIEKLEDLTDLAVVVCPAPVSSAISSRNARLRTHNLDIAVMRRAEATNAAVDPLMALLEEIDVFLWDREYRGLPMLQTNGETFHAAWQSSAMVGSAEAGYAPEILKSKGCFVGVLRVEYQVGL
jgi:hypothetical protein